MDSDPDKNGKPSDHKIVKMKPINTVENISARDKRQVTFRPIPDSGLNQLIKWAENERWENVINVKSTHVKAKNMQDTLLNATNKFLPIKTSSFNTDDSPWVTSQIKTHIRKRQREYRKHRRSDKWSTLNDKVKELIKNAKGKYYKNVVADLKESNDGQWYSKLKKISSFNKHLQKPIIVSEISEYTDQEQADLIADKFSKISNEYDAIKTSDIKIPFFTQESIPHTTHKKVEITPKQLNTKVSTVSGDIPAKV